MEEMNKQAALAKAIMDKCKELGCDTPKSVAELIGGATLVILSAISERIEAPMEDVRKEYIRGLAEAE